MLRTTLLLLLAFFNTSPALAAWGENWGEMVWGASAPPAAVPMTGWPGLFLLLTVLLVTALWKMKRMPRQVGLTLSLFLLVPVMIAPHITTWNGLTWYAFINGEVADANEINMNFEAIASILNVSVPNSFANSGVADADDINSNFEVLIDAVNQFTTDAAVATAATEAAYNNGVASVDITSDNAAAFANGVASVDITTDNAAAFADGVSSVDITTDNAAAAASASAAAGSAACTQAGGTWDAGTSNCAPGGSYNCFQAGFCAAAATFLAPGVWAGLDMNDFAGHSLDSEPASAHCSSGLKNDQWDLGQIAMAPPFSWQMWDMRIQQNPYICQRLDNL